MNYSDARVVARIDTPSDVGYNSDSLDVCNDIGYGIEYVNVDALIVVLGTIAIHWMSVMTSALVQSRIRSKALSTMGTIMARVP